MSCEHVEDLLSAYLDNALTPQERVIVQEHTRTCSRCREILADYRRFDALLTDLPRVSPGDALREKIFSSPDYLELTGTTGITSLHEFRRARSKVNERTELTDLLTTGDLQQSSKTQQGQQQTTTPRITPYGARLTLPQKSKSRGRDTSHAPTRPRLVALPGGLQETQPRLSTLPHSDSERAGRQSSARRRPATGVRIMQLAIAVCMLLTLGVGSFIGVHLWQQQSAGLAGVIAPPLGSRLGGPLPAGTRFVFLRDGALWSGSTDSTTSTIARLTPNGVTVASTWQVRPAFTGRAAGNMVAYIDLKQGRIHLIRSDGQSDTAIAQALFPTYETNVTASSQWNTSTGISILNSLAWSPDGSMLAFLAASTDGLHLYIYRLDTGHVEMLPGTLRGEVLSLGWSSDAHSPALTWSSGTPGHISSLLLQSINAASYAKTLASGDYAEARYSQSGGWLLLSQQHDIYTLKLDGGTYRWTTNGNASLVQWSPESSYIGYFQGLSNHAGIYHVINTTTGSDTQLASGIASQPAPLWSEDEHTLLYWNGTHLVITRDASTTQVALPGVPSLIGWNPATHSVALIASNTGLYSLDIIHGTTAKISTSLITSALQWTEIP